MYARIHGIKAKAYRGKTQNEVQKSNNRPGTGGPAAGRVCRTAGRAGTRPAADGESSRNPVRRYLYRCHGLPRYRAELEPCGQPVRQLCRNMDSGRRHAGCHNGGCHQGARAGPGNRHRRDRHQSGPQHRGNSGPEPGLCDFECRGQ